MPVAGHICRFNHETICTFGGSNMPSGADLAGTTEQVWVCLQGSKQNPEKIVCDKKAVKEVVIGEKKIV